MRLMWAFGLSLAAVAVVIVLAVSVFNAGFTHIAVCDAWSVTLDDGTVLTPPPDVIETAGPEGGGYGPCWDLPAWVTSEDLDGGPPGTQPSTVGD